MLNFWDNLMETDEHAAEYMKSHGEGPGYITRLTIGDFVNVGESILDVGCGPGWMWDHFAEYGPIPGAYKGIDYSERFVRVANKRHKGMFELGDCRDLKEPDKSWDVVLLQDVLEHTNGYEKPVIEALRVARKRVIISFWHLDNNEGTEHINDDGNDGYGAWYDKEKWESWLNSLPYVWHHDEIAPEGKTHKWHFYIIDLEDV
jgi:ubiquinone/menaquinone biosynthesis C-methylase UbiE